MNKIETFTMQSPAPDVLRWLTSDEIFSHKKVKDLVTSNGLLTDIYDHDKLLHLLDSGMFRAIFEDNWQFETDSQWVGRQAAEAIGETVLHAITDLADKAQTELMNMHSGQFPGLDRGQIDVIFKQSLFLADYYRLIFKEDI